MQRRLFNVQAGMSLVPMQPLACLRPKAMGFTCAIDSTLNDPHHRSRHYEQRCRHYGRRDKTNANLRRSRTALGMPKLSLSVDTRSHIILVASARTRMGSDSSEFYLCYGNPSIAALDSGRRWPMPDMIHI